MSENTVKKTGRSTLTSIRLDRGVKAKIDQTALRLGISSNRLMAMVLREYVYERGVRYLEKILEQGPSDERGDIDLFK